MSDSKFTIDNLKLALDSLGISPATADKAQVHFMKLLGEGKLHREATGLAIDFAAKGLKANKEARIRAAKHIAGLTIGSGVDSITERISTGVHDFKEKRQQRPDKAPKPKPAAKAKREQKYRDWTFRPLAYAAVLFGGALIGFVLGLALTAPLVSSQFAEIGESWRAPTYIVTLVLTTLLGFYAAKVLINRRRARFGYKEALKAKEFDHPSHNTAIMVWVVGILVVVLVGSFFVVAYQLRNITTAIYGSGGGVTGNVIIMGVVFGIALIFIGILVVDMVRRKTNYYDKTEDRPLNEETRKALQLESETTQRSQRQKARTTATPTPAPTT